MAGHGGLGENDEEMDVDSTGGDSVVHGMWHTR
jgi:hypothetical protein